MTEHEQQRFDMLRQGPCMRAEYIRDYYGLAWPLADDLRSDFEAWASQKRRKTVCGDKRISRYELESFMQQKDVVPKKWMGARLGMTFESFDRLLSRLDDIGMRQHRYVVYPEMISESLSEDIVHNLPGLKFRTFSDHNSFCQSLHAELEKVLKLKVEALYCATSERVQDDPRQFASQFDCITLEPLSVKHELWLDFKKPLNLGPDRCSKLLYVENRAALQTFCAGTQEPDDLEQYEQFFAGQLHG